MDDEIEFVSTLAERLSLRGIEADWANSAEKAFEYAEKNNYDLAVLDVKMPRIGGIELKQSLEKICEGLRFIYLTGHGSEADYRAGSAEAVHYLVKPVHIDALIEKMKETLGQ